MRHLGGKILDGVAVTLGWWLTTLAIAGVFAAARKAQTAAASRAKVAQAVQRVAASPAVAEHPSFQPYLRIASPWPNDHEP